MSGRILGAFAILGMLSLNGTVEAEQVAEKPIQETSVLGTDASSEVTTVSGPEARVAAMVREALRTPEDIETWRCLDLALSEMNAPVGNGRDLSSRAQRAADSLTCPNGSVFWTASSSSFPPTRPGGPEGSSRSSEIPNGAWQRVLPSLKNMWQYLVGNPWVITIGLLLSSGVLIWLSRSTVMKTLAGRKDQPAVRETDTGQSGPENPVAMALALWEGGLPSPEIARRTGLAQDALSVLLNLRVDGDPVPADGPKQGANPYPQARIERR